MADNYNVEVKITSHKKEIVAELEQAMLQALEAIGMEAEGHAQDTIRTAGLKIQIPLRYGLPLQGRWRRRRRKGYQFSL